VEAMPERKMAMLHFSEVFPLPGLEAFDYLDVLKRAKRTVSIEMNATGQFARLLRYETGYSVTDRVLRYDGRPFLVEELMEEL